VSGCVRDDSLSLLKDREHDILQTACGNFIGVARILSGGGALCALFFLKKLMTFLVVALNTSYTR